MTINKRLTLKAARAVAAAGRQIVARVVTMTDSNRWPGHEVQVQAIELRDEGRLLGYTPSIPASLLQHIVVQPQQPEADRG